MARLSIVAVDVFVVLIIVVITVVIVDVVLIIDVIIEIVILFRIPHHAPGRLFEGVLCPSASGRDLTRVKNKNLQLRNWGVQ